MSGGSIAKASMGYFGLCSWFTNFGVSSGSPAYLSEKAESSELVYTKRISMLRDMREAISCNLDLTARGSSSEGKAKFHVSTAPFQQVGSHYHFIDVNPHLVFDRRKAVEYIIWDSYKI